MKEMAIIIVATLIVVARTDIRRMKLEKAFLFPLIRFLAMYAERFN